MIVTTEVGVYYNKIIKRSPLMLNVINKWYTIFGGRYEIDVIIRYKYDPLKCIITRAVIEFFTWQNYTNSIDNKFNCIYAYQVIYDLSFFFFLKLSLLIEYFFGYTYVHGIYKPINFLCDALCVKIEIRSSSSIIR